MICSPAEIRALSSFQYFDNVGWVTKQPVPLIPKMLFSGLNGRKKRNGLNEIEFERIIKMETMMLMMVMKK